MIFMTFLSQSENDFIALQLNCFPLLNFKQKSEKIHCEIKSLKSHRTFEF